MSARRVLAVANNFPTGRFPEKGVFVMNALQEMTKQGASVDVIAPRSWIAELKLGLRRPLQIDFGALSVAAPYVTALPLRAAGFERTITAFNERRFAAAVARSVDAGVDYDFMFAHFLPAGRALVRALRSRRAPAVLNLGESDPWDYDQLYGQDWTQGLLEFDAVITVSRRNHDFLLLREPRIADRLSFVPNGVDTSRFKPLDRTLCRAALGLPQEAKIVMFCGHFDHRKGPLRVLGAVRRVGVSGVFLGSNGPDRPGGAEVLYAGSVVNSDLPQWYGAADVFALPSLSEGMSNAMLEALACGLPLVVGDLDFNRGFLNDQCARFVDPADEASIAAGIADALEPLRNSSMREASLRLAHELSLQRRVERIFALAAESARGAVRSQRKRA